MIFNSLLGNGWSDLDDFFGRPHVKFRKMVHIFLAIFVKRPIKLGKLFQTQTRQSKQCGFSIYTFDNLKSKSMVILVRAEKMVLSGLVFARKIARMILIQNI